MSKCDKCHAYSDGFKDGVAKALYKVNKFIDEDTIGCISEELLGGASESRKEPLYLEWDGRVLCENEDGSISISLNRADMLQSAECIYNEFLEKGEEDFKSFLKKELEAKNGEES